MPVEVKEVAEKAFDAFKDALKGFVDSQEVDEFAKGQIKLYAQESLAALRASTPEKKAEHETNLKHLVAQARGEARRLQIAITTEAKNSIGQVLETIGGMFIKVLPVIIGAL